MYSGQTDWLLGTNKKVFDPEIERTEQRMLPEIPKCHRIPKDLKHSKPNIQQLSVDFR